MWKRWQGREREKKMHETEAELNDYFAGNFTLNQKLSIIRKHRAGVMLMNHPDLIYIIGCELTLDEQESFRLVNKTFASMIKIPQIVHDLHRNVDRSFKFIQDAVTHLKTLQTDGLIIFDVDPMEIDETIVIHFQSNGSDTHVSDFQLDIDVPFSLLQFYDPNYEQYIYINLIQNEGIVFKDLFDVKSDFIKLIENCRIVYSTHDDFWDLKRELIVNLDFENNYLRYRKYVSWKISWVQYQLKIN